VAKHSEVIESLKGVPKLIETLLSKQYETEDPNQDEVEGQFENRAMNYENENEDDQNPVSLLLSKRQEEGTILLLIKLKLSYLLRVVE